MIATIEYKNPKHKEKNVFTFDMFRYPLVTTRQIITLKEILQDKKVIPKNLYIELNNHEFYLTYKEKNYLGTESIYTKKIDGNGNVKDILKNNYFNYDNGKFNLIHSFKINKQEFSPF